VYTTNNSDVEGSLLMKENKELPDLFWGSHDRYMREAIGEIGVRSEKSSFSEAFAMLILEPGGLARMGYLRVRPLVF